jgi:hypothetical protein
MRFINKLRVFVYGILIAWMVTTFSSSIIGARVIDESLAPYFGVVAETVFQQCKKGQYYLPETIQVQFEKMKPNTYGYCRRGFNGFRIAINPITWYSELNEVDRYQLIIHEGVHCLFREPHRDDKEHFMYAYFRVIDREVLWKQFNEFIKTRCKN